MKAPRLALALTAIATAAAGALLIVPAHAADGDAWSGFKVVDVQPAATTQTAILGMMPRYKQGSTELYLWNIVRMVRDKNGNESWVYCIEQKQQGESPTYVEDSSKGTTLGKANLGEINRVLASSTLPDPGDLQVTAPDANWVNPAVDVLPQRKADHIEVTAVQLALWHYTEGLNFNASNTVEIRDYYPNSYTGDANTATMADVLARYDALVAEADAHPLSNPNPTITIAPADSSTDAGKALTVTVTGKDIEGGIQLATDPAGTDLYGAGTDGACDTTKITSLPSDGGKVCVSSAAAASLKITASGHSAGNTTHTLYATDAQTIIGVGPDAVSADATFTWTRTTPSPSSSASSSSSPSTSPSTSPSASTSASTTPSPSTSETSSQGGAVVTSSSSPTETANSSGGGGNAVSPSSALADTGANGLMNRLALALGALALGSLFVLATRRRTERTP